MVMTYGKLLFMSDPRAARAAICNAVASVLREADVTGYALEKEHGLCSSSIRKICAGKTEPSSQMIFRIEAALGADWIGSIYERAAEFAQEQGELQAA